MPKARQDYKYVRNIDEEKRIYNRDILPKLRQATLEDYTNWLAGYIFKGGKIEHCRSRGLDLYNYYVATENIIMVPLTGSSAINIIIPSNIDITIPEHNTHNNFFFMLDYTCIANTSLELRVVQVPLIIDRGITYLQMLDSIEELDYDNNFIYQFIDLVPPKDLCSLFDYTRYPIVGELAEEKYNQSIVTVRTVGKRYPIETVLGNIIEENTYIDKVDQIVESMKSGKSYIEAKKEIGLDKSEDDLNTFLDVADALGEKEANTKPYTPKLKPNRYTAIELDAPRESLFTKIKKIMWKGSNT